MFGFDLYPNCDVVAGLEERIDLLKKVNASENGYQLVLPIGAEIGDNYVSNHNKFIIRQKLLFLIKAYQIALDEIESWCYMGRSYLPQGGGGDFDDIERYDTSRNRSDMNHRKINRLLAKINIVV